MEYLADIIASGNTENYKKVQIMAIELKQAEDDLKKYHDTFRMLNKFFNKYFTGWRNKWAEYYVKNKNQISDLTNKVEE